jgi:hypothetical protein
MRLISTVGYLSLFLAGGFFTLFVYQMLLAIGCATFTQQTPVNLLLAASIWMFIAPWLYVPGILLLKQSVPADRFIRYQYSHIALSFLGAEIIYVIVRFWRMQPG